MADFIPTTLGYLHELRQRRDRLAVAQSATEVCQTIGNVIPYLSEGLRAKLNSLIGSTTPLEEIQRTALSVFDEFHCEEEAARWLLAEKERNDALVQLRQLADELRHRERCTDADLSSLWNRLNGLIEYTDEDLRVLCAIDRYGDQAHGREALLKVIEAHLASGQAGKFWL